MIEAPSNPDLILLRRELGLERRKRELRKSNEIAFYVPHLKQSLFHAAGCFHYRYARTGNRWGKSECGAAEDVSYALGFRPWIPEGLTIRTEYEKGLFTEKQFLDFKAEFRDIPLRTLGIPPHATKGLIVTTDWDKSKEVFTEIEGVNKGKLFKYIPSNALGQPTKNHSGAIDRIPVRHVSGDWSVIHLDTVKSYKQNPLGQESSVWDWIHLDEPVPEGMFNAINRGLIDRGGKAWFTCTPLTEPWIDERFIPDTQSQSRDGVNFSHGDYWMMTGNTYDNPHNTQENIDRVMNSYSEEERECRLTGLPAAYSGIVYKEFRWNEHVLRDVPSGWKSWAQPPPEYSLRFAIDYHPRKPHAVLFIATSPHDVSYVYAEIWYSCIMSELVSEIQSVLGAVGSTVPGLIDPLASTPNRVTDVTALEEVLRAGLPVLPATKDPHNGILKVKELLTRRDRKGQPVLFFNAGLTHTLSEISRKYMWDGETNKPLKKDDDMMENLYRLALQGLDYIEPSMTDYFPSNAAKRVELPDNVLDIREFDGPFDDPETKRKAVNRSRNRTRYAC